MRHFFKYADRINTKYAAEICGNHYGVSLAGVSCRRRWPAATTLARWASRQAVGGSWGKIFFLLPMFIMSIEYYAPSS